ncbi:MAG: hypothetical protein KTR15_14955 [Phycisphaeraceae bacterium]|nr:hypothetical protein [Phycisphaeraceae bacterium]
MPDLLHRPIASLSICFVLLSALLYAQPVSAQSEGLELKHSPNGKRALRLHAEKQAGLEADYLESIELPAKRFNQTCERHVNRYTSMLDREIRTLTRKGALEEAKAIQSAIQRAEAWSIAPPDGEGLHFLSQETLEVVGSDKATKLGVDLQVNVESAGVAYAKHIQQAFGQYKLKIDSARNLLKGELTTVLEQEQRAGRLEAVQEVQAAIDAIKTLPAVTAPKNEEPEQADEADEPAEQPKDRYHGYYVLRHEANGKTQRRYLLELGEEESAIREYNTADMGGSWQNVDWHVKVIREQGSKLLIQSTDDHGNELIHELSLRENRRPHKATTWRSRQDYDNKREPVGSGYVQIPGTPDADLLGLKDGEYFMAMTRTYSATYSHPLAYRVRVLNGTIVRTHENVTDDPDQWKRTYHVFYTVKTEGKRLVLRQDATMRRNISQFMMVNMSGKRPKIAGWSSKLDYDRKDDPDYQGELIKGK